MTLTPAFSSQLIPAKGDKSKWLSHTVVYLYKNNMKDLKVKNYKDDARKTFDKMAVKYEKHYYGSQSRILYKKVALIIEKFNNEFILDLGCGKGFFKK